MVEDHLVEAQLGRLAEAVDALNVAAKHDPPAALFAGPDGLDAYRAILPDLPRLLAEGGRAVFEIGATQAAAVSVIARNAGLDVLDIKRDLAKRERCIVLAAR